MSTIRVLPPEIASQIAAGEVIERPASVVKELVENALDAGATRVAITVAGGGKQRIEVADDGQGIPASELPLAVERHATSKLHRSEDLFQIGTLGFRGEALASIGSVSRLTLTSKVPESQSGARIRVEGGHAGGVESIGAPQGTLVLVEDLFFNVPARLKFLKTERTERSRIAELVTRYALAYPDVRFTLTQEGRSAVQTAGNGDQRAVLAAIYGPEEARQMLSVNAAYEDIHIRGFTSPPGLTRSNRREITFFVNGRWVQDIALSTALVQAYHTLLMVGRYPVAVLFLQIPADAVDVNVHPAKSEIRLHDARRVFADVQRSIRRALLAHAPVPGLEEAGLRWTPPDREPSGTAAWGSGPGQEPSNRSLPFTQPTRQDVPDQAALSPQGGVPLLRPVGQVASAYLVAEGPDGLYLVDQHAAHERVLFEQLMAQRGDPVPSQALLEPETVALSPAQAGLLEGQLSSLQRLGFQVEDFGPNTFIVRALPALLAGMSPRAALLVLVEDFEEDETPLQAEIEARIIARVCKRAAVKAGQTLSAQEQRALIRDLESCESPRTCPHGRPTMIHLSVDLLERQFGRRGAR
jgi:DNA mismatch repair protein MutL